MMLFVVHIDYETLNKTNLIYNLKKKKKKKKDFLPSDFYILKEKNLIFFKVYLRVKAFLPPIE